MSWWRRFLGWFAGVDDTFAPPAPLPPHPAYYEADVMGLFNALRREHGIAPLEADPVLATLAQDWAESMARHETLGHGDFASRVAVRYPSGITAEDIAMGQFTAAEVSDDWMRSPGHRAQILNPEHRYVGVGRAVSRSGNTFWCADFRS